ncbi:MAG: CDP-alcohol phosphatidyltransferase family protein [Candidatus Nanoarchaeia archaeon]|jgi:phosphatidylglycerophosphate synthase
MIKPNHLTITGLVLGITALFTQKWISLLLFSTAFALDLADGWLARKKKLSTAFGGVLDSVSDKIIEVLFIYYISNLMNAQGLGIIVAGLSIMISYVKQRAGLKNKTIFDRAQRMIYLLITTIFFKEQAIIAYVIFISLCLIAITQLMVKSYKKN